MFGIISLFMPKKLCEQTPFARAWTKSIKSLIKTKCWKNTEASGNMMQRNGYVHRWNKN